MNQRGVRGWFKPTLGHSAVIHDCSGYGIEGLKSGLGHFFMPLS